MPKENESNNFHVPKVLYENRYCNQEGFSILVCGGEDRKYNLKKRVFGFKLPNVELNFLQW